MEPAAEGPPPPVSYNAAPGAMRPPASRGSEELRQKLHGTGSLGEQVGSTEAMAVSRKMVVD